MAIPKSYSGQLNKWGWLLSWFDLQSAGESDINLFGGDIQCVNRSQGQAAGQIVVFGVKEKSS